VSFVDRNQAEPACHRTQRIDESRTAKPLRRHIDQREQPGANALEDLALLFGTGGRRQGDRGHAPGAQRIHLILHQRDQRRDHQRHAAALGQDHRWHLVAQRFAGPGRHHRDHRPTR
jgi:hypothetical protein